MPGYGGIDPSGRHAKSSLKNTYLKKKSRIPYNFHLISTVEYCQFQGISNFAAMKLKINEISIEELLNKRVIDMTGQELVDLIGSAVQQATLRSDTSEPKEKKLLHGKKEIASALSVSTSTISRWLDNGTIHAPAVIRADRVLLFDYDLVIEQIQASEGLRWKGKEKGNNTIQANRRSA